MLKIVIDTNLLVAHLFNKKSFAARIINLSRQGEIEILWSDAIKKEAEYILSNISRSANRKKLEWNKIFKEKNKIKNPPRLRVIAEDPEDDKFLACAWAGGADLIVSSDRHLLDLGSFRKIPIKGTKDSWRVIIEKNRK